MSWISLMHSILTTADRRKRNFDEALRPNFADEEEALEQSAVATELSFSKRCQRSLKKELEVEKEIFQQKLYLGGVVKRLEKLREIQKGCEYQIVNHGANEAYARSKLGELINDIAGDDRVKQIVEERLEGLQKELESLREPTEEEATARRKTQLSIAHLLTERLSKDELIQNTILGLRQLLEERRQMTAQMEQLGESIDLDVAFDHVRFARLFEALPNNVSDESRKWTAYFLGAERRPGSVQYRVVNEPVIVEQTLAHPGVYLKGETVWLSAEEAEKHGSKVKKPTD